MHPVLEDLIALLQLERIEDNIFRGDSRDIGSAQVFGGQVLGQALSAAQHTVEDRVAPPAGIRPRDATSGSEKMKIFQKGIDATKRAITIVPGTEAVFLSAASLLSSTAGPSSISQHHSRTRKTGWSTTPRCQKCRDRKDSGTCSIFQRRALSRRH